MKFWMYLLSIPFLTATLSAQIPYFGGYSYSQPYYPGANLAPYYPQAYYPQPYSSLWAYPLDQIPGPNNDAIDALTQQVQQLNNEVLQLQAELAATRAQADQAQQAQQAMTRAAEPPPGPPGPETILVFKNGQVVISQGYAIAGDTLWVMTPSGSQRILLSSLDLQATEIENFKRGLQFPHLER